MTNIYDLEKHRLKLYGEMLKYQSNEKRKAQKVDREEKLKRDSEELQHHIENTRKFQMDRKMEQKQLGYSLKEDNMYLSSLKRKTPSLRNYAEEGKNFLNQISDLDSKRLDKLKNSLHQQYQDNRHHIEIKHQIQQKIKQIQKLQSDRHFNRIKDMQIESIRNHEDIKRKHQQDMNIYQKHKQLINRNQNYRDRIQSFTKVDKGIFDRYNRNQYFQRRANLLENQDQIKKQIDQFQRRKSQDAVQYKRKIGDLEHSMLSSILTKPQKYQPRAYSNELKNQINQHHLKLLDEESNNKKKVQIKNIFGGYQGNQREKIIKIIDKGLGLADFQFKKQMNSNRNFNPQKKLEVEIQTTEPSKENPELAQSKRYLTPRVLSRGSSNSKQKQRLEQSQQQISYSHQKPKDYDEASELSSNAKKYFMSFDVITGKHRYYGTE